MPSASKIQLKGGNGQMKSRAKCLLGMNESTPTLGPNVNALKLTDYCL